MLNINNFPPLVDEDGSADEGLKFLGSSQLGPEATKGLQSLGQAQEAKAKLTKGQRSAVTRKINAAKKQGWEAVEALLMDAEADPDSEASKMVVEALGDHHRASGESDPSGLTASTPGAKLDSGKVDMAQILSSFPRALFAVGSVGLFGAEKYSFEGWLEVSQGVHRYSSAGIRHFLKQFIEGPIDSDSKMHHLAHEAWNSLAKLELYCRENNIDGQFEVK
jgi:hypothetical protein